MPFIIFSCVLIQIFVFSFSRRLNNTSRALSSFTYRPALPHTVPPIHLPTPALLLLVSNRVPAYEVKETDGTVSVKKKKPQCEDEHIISLPVCSLLAAAEWREGRSDCGSL